MKRWIKASLIAVLVLIGLAVFLLYTPDSDREKMMAQYGAAPSTFLDDGHGGTIHYREQGRKDGPILLLIHGANGSLHTWEYMIAHLQDKYRLISVDLYGHGLTGPNKRGVYDADAQIGAGVAVLDHLGIEKATWVGSSMGGWISWRAALAVPQRVSSLILIDASGAQTEEKIKPYLAARLMRTALGKAILPYVAPRFAVRSSIEENYAQEERIREKDINRYWHMARFPGNRQAAIKRTETDREPEKWSEAGDIFQPALILWGRHDRVIPVSHGHEFDSKLPQSKLIIYEDAGHLPMEETPQQVARDIDIWMSGLKDGEGDNASQNDIEAL